MTQPPTASPGPLVATLGDRYRLERVRTTWDEINLSAESVAWESTA